MSVDSRTLENSQKSHRLIQYIKLDVKYVVEQSGKYNIRRININCNYNSNGNIYILIRTVTRLFVFENSHSVDEINYICLTK